MRDERNKNFDFQNTYFANINSAYDKVEELQKELAVVKKENERLKISNEQKTVKNTKTGEDKKMINQMYWALHAWYGDFGSKRNQAIIKSKIKQKKELGVCDEFIRCGFIKVEKRLGLN